jgi:tetratricopeptide (TPR) repeat protein
MDLSLGQKQMGLYMAKTFLLILIFLVWIGEANAREKIAEKKAVPLSDQPICSRSQRDTVTILVGPFTVAGQEMTTSNISLEQIIPFAIAGWLTASPNLRATPYKGNYIGFEGRQYTDLLPLLAAPILYDHTPAVTENGRGNRPTDEDIQANRRITNLSRVLRRAGCDYLFGGHITIGVNENLIISSYLLTTETAELSRKTGTIIPDSSITASQAAGMLASNLLKVLNPKSPKSTNLEVACFRVNGAPDPSVLEFAKVLATKAQEAVIDDLATNPAYPELASPQQAVCSTPEAVIQSDSTREIITAEIGFDGDDVTLAPYVRIIRNDKQIHTSVPIRLSPTTAHKNHLSAAIRNYIEQVHLFVNAIQSTDQGEGILKDFDQSLSREVLLNALQPVIPGAEASLSDNLLVLGYRALSQRPDDPQSLAVLGAALLQKQKPNFAMYTLDKAIKLMSTQPQPYVLGRCYEMLGQAQKEEGYKKKAIESLKSAIRIYRKSGLADLGRANRALALLLLSDGDKDGAIKQLEMQGNLTKDYDSLILLSSIRAAEGDMTSARDLLSKAAPLIPPSDKQRALALGDVYEALGNALLGSRDLDSAKQARDLFEKALDLRESQRTRYLAGFAAYKSRDFTGASEHYQQIVSHEGEPRWTEAAWLNLVECLVLQGKFNDASSQADKALERLSGPVFDDSRLVVLYVQLIARALSPGSKPKDSDELVSKIQKLSSEGTASISKLLWQSDELDSFLRDPRRYLGARPYSADGIPIVARAREMLFESSNVE